MAEKSDYEKLVESGEWYLDTEAPDYKEKLLKDVLEKNQTPQVQEETQEQESWYEQLVAGYVDKYKDQVGGKYGAAGLEEMVNVHFRQLATKLKLYGLTPEFKKELEMLTSIYQPFLKKGN